MGDLSIDNLSSAVRSETMRRVRSKHTKPELALRRLVFSMGYRYRLHATSLPGKPDLVFAKRKKAIFMHGCFWHQHRGCSRCRMPKTRRDYWQAKLEGNVRRDRVSRQTLRRLGWQSMVVWECELPKGGNLASRIAKFLGETKASPDRS